MVQGWAEDVGRQMLAEHLQHRVGVALGLVVESGMSHHQPQKLRRRSPPTGLRAQRGHPHQRLQPDRPSAQFEDDGEGGAKVLVRRPGPTEAQVRVSQVVVTDGYLVPRAGILRDSQALLVVARRLLEVAQLSC